MWHADHRRLKTGRVPLVALFVSWVLSIALISLCIVTEIENAHFEFFFPRRSVAPWSTLAYPFEVTAARDEGGWRSWRFAVTGDETLLYRPLTNTELLLMKSWIADAVRWNVFVHLVKRGCAVEIGIVVLLLTIRIVCTRLSGCGVRNTWDWWAMNICIGIAMLVVVVILFRGYGFATFGDWDLLS